MFNSEGKQLAALERVFLEPADPTHRQYETLCVFFIEGLSSHEVTKRFGYTTGNFRLVFGWTLVVLGLFLNVGIQASRSNDRDRNARGWPL